MSQHGFELIDLWICELRDSLVAVVQLVPLTLLVICTESNVIGFEFIAVVKFRLRYILKALNASSSLSLYSFIIQLSLFSQFVFAPRSIANPRFTAIHLRKPPVFITTGKKYESTRKLLVPIYCLSPWGF